MVMEGGGVVTYGRCGHCLGGSISVKSAMRTSAPNNEQAPERKPRLLLLQSLLRSRALCSFTTCALTIHLPPDGSSRLI